MLLIFLIYEGYRIIRTKIRRYRCKKDLHLLPLKYINNHNCQVRSNCFLDYSYNEDSCIVRGPAIYHSCIEKSHLGLLFRILHYSIFSETDYPHLKALHYHTDELDWFEKRQTRILYKLMTLRYPNIKRFIDSRLITLPSNQYKLICSYIGYNHRIELIRRFNEGYYRCSEESKRQYYKAKVSDDIELHKLDKLIQSSTFTVDCYQLGHSLLAKSYITFNYIELPKISIYSYYEPVRLSIRDIENVKVHENYKQIQLINNCTIEIIQDEYEDISNSSNTDSSDSSIITDVSSL